MSVKEELNTETISKSGFYKKYKVIMHNDNKTTVDFVIAILMQYYEKSINDAITIASKIHHSGADIVGIYPLEGAEFRVEQTHSAARSYGFPLQCSIEPE